MIARDNMHFDLRLEMGANLPLRMGFGPSTCKIFRVGAVGVNTARFAPSIMTPTVWRKLQLDLTGDRAQVDGQTRGSAPTK